MKKLVLSFATFFSITTLLAQPVICNPNGNLMLFTNYDGGALTINVNANIPNLKIGIVSYEAMTVTLTGTYVNNVTGIGWAGYNGTNNPCGVIATTTINGAPAGVIPTISVMPTSPITNTNGYNIIICGYSCSTTTNQGGCNTIDQIEAYWHNAFPGSVLYAHNVQYNCFANTQTVSAGGTCCSNTVSVSELTYENNFSVYPNPATNFIDVKINKSLSNAVYSIVDQLGRTVLTGKLVDESTSIKINELAPGLYLFKMGQTNQQTIKVLKK